MNNKKLILIVDDDHVYKLVTRRMIELWCSQTDISLATNGREALDQLQSAIDNPLMATPLPDIIFLDIEMPEMNGWDFLTAFAQLTSPAIKNIQIYVVSSSIDERDLKRIQQYPFVKELLIKPFSTATLNSILNRHLHSP